MKKIYVGLVSILLVTVMLVSFGLSRLSYVPTNWEITVTATEPGRAGSLLALFLGRADYVSQKCCVHSQSIGEGPEGSDVIWMEIRSNDPLVKGSHRAENRFKSHPFGVLHRVEAQIYLGSDWPESDLPVTLMQWHGARDRLLLEGGRFPPLELVVEGTDWVLISSVDPKLISDGKPARRNEIARFPVVHGRVHTWTFDIRWSINDDGIIAASLDGTRVANLRGPNTHNDMVAPYLKYGVYSPKWKHALPSSDVRVRAAFPSVTIQPNRNPEPDS